MYHNQMTEEMLEYNIELQLLLLFSSDVQD